MDKKLKKIQLISLILTVIFCLISIFWWNKQIFFGVFIGGALVTLNFFFLTRIITTVLSGSSKKITNSLLYFVKLVVFFGAVFLCIKYLPINHFAFFMGISILFFAVLVEFILGLFNVSKEA